MVSPKRGDVFNAPFLYPDLAEGKLRPICIVSADDYNASGADVVVRYERVLCRQQADCRTLAGPRSSVAGKLNRPRSRARGSRWLVWHRLEDERTIRAAGLPQLGR